MAEADSVLEAVFRREHGLVLASLVRTFDDFDLAEDALSDAVSAALDSWVDRGVPDNPAAWLLTVARRKGIDRLRRQKALAARLPDLEAAAWFQDEEHDDGAIPDERLHLLFACCHPALSPEAQVALTLKSLGGLTTAEIARAFLTTEPTMYQRITRARKKMRLAGIPVQMPSASDLPERLQSVLAVIYLVFNEGYSPMGGEDPVRIDLSEEALRLCEMLTTLMPDEPEVRGLAALCMLTDARRPARFGPDGALNLLESQDRSLWDRTKIDRGLGQLDAGRALGTDGPYMMQAEIAAVHAGARTWEETDWDRIVGLYGRLLEREDSPVVALNLAAAVAMRDGPDVGLALMDKLAEPLDGYQPFHASRAELLLRAGRTEEAAEGFRRALEFQLNEWDRRHLESRQARASRYEMATDPSIPSTSHPASECLKRYVNQVPQTFPHNSETGT